MLVKARGHPGLTKPEKHAVISSLLTRNLAGVIPNVTARKLPLTGEPRVVSSIPVTDIGPVPARLNAMVRKHTGNSIDHFTGPLPKVHFGGGTSIDFKNDKSFVCQCVGPALAASATPSQTDRAHESHRCMHELFSDAVSGESDGPTASGSGRLAVTITPLRVPGPAGRVGAGSASSGVTVKKVLVKAPPTGNADPARDLDFFIINFKLNAHDLDGTDSESEPDSEESALASCLHREGVLPRNCSLRLSSVASGIILAYEVQRGDVADSQASTAPGMSSFALQHGDLVVMHWTRIAPLKDASSSARATAVTPRSRSVEALVGRGGLQARFLLAVLYAAPGPAGSVSVSREFTNALSSRAALSLYYEVCRRVRCASSCTDHCLCMCVW